MRSFDIQLVACSSCQLHHRASDRACPHCGAERAGGAKRTAAAMLLGLAVASPAALTGCGDDTTGSGGNGGAGGATTTSQNVSSAYGTGPSTTDSSSSSADTSSVASAYGAGPTTGSGGGGQ